MTMHHHAGVNFENFTEVQFRDVLLTGTGHRDRRLNRDTSDQTGAYGWSNLNQNLKPKPKSNFRFIRKRPFAIPSFHQKCRPGALPPLRPSACRGPVSWNSSTALHKWRFSKFSNMLHRLDMLAKILSFLH